MRLALAFCLLTLPAFADAPREAEAAAAEGRYEAAAAIYEALADEPDTLGRTRLLEAAQSARRVGYELQQAAIRPGGDRKAGPYGTRVLRAALALCEALDGPESLGVAQIVDLLRESLVLDGDAKERLALARRHLAILEHHHGYDDLRLIGPLVALANELYRVDTEEAERLWLRTVALLDRQYADDPERLANAYHGIISFYESWSRAAVESEAERAEREARRWQRRANRLRESMPPEEAESVDSLIQQAIAETKPRRAEALYLEALELARAEEDPAAIWRAAQMAASFYIRDEDFERAEPMIEALFAASEGSETRLQQAYVFAAFFAQQQDDPATALSHTRKSLELIPESNREGRVGALVNLARAQMNAGELEQAVSLGEQALTGHLEFYGPDHILTTNPLMVLTEIHTARKEYAAARRYLLQRIEIVERQQGGSSLLESLKRQAATLGRRAEE